MSAERAPREGGAPAAGRGRVYLVGAGPGDPGLLTARALALIASADVILYDRLIPSEALSGARADAELLFVGKEGGGPSVPQEQTEQLIVDRALAGRDVVRLKGGDPFVFGRGGEEALRLVAEGIEFEVVPGVTSGVAAPAYAGIPVTQRGVSLGVALVTGHTREDLPGAQGDGLDWEALARFPGTLVFYMGISRLPDIAAGLIAAGRSPQEPCAVIEQGTLPGQRTVRGTLASIAEDVAREGVRPPSITLVGAVAQLAEQLAWRSARPLAGRTVVVTRARTQSSSLARRLQALGAAVLELPTIRIQPLPVTRLDLAPYDLLCLTSPNAVAILFERLFEASLDARALAGLRVAAIGPATARELAERGVRADVVPERAVAESLVEALAGVPVSRALVARAREARDVLPDALRRRGAEVEVLALYETVAERPAERELQRALQADYLTFTSSSTVNNLLSALSDAGGAGAIPSSARIASIGPATTATLREHGLQPDVEAARHDLDGLVEALTADACAHRAS